MKIRANSRSRDCVSFPHTVRRTILSAAVAASLSATLSTQAVFAQDADDEALDEVVVTGSFIRNSKFAQNNPVETVTQADLVEAGQPNVAVFIRDLTFTQNTNVVANVNAGSAGTQSSVGTTFNLRGLGENSTLTLMDGVRSVDNGINTLVPDIAIDRLEVVLDGGSAIYGSDAVAGVINLIPIKKFDGFRTQLYYQQDSEDTFDDAKFSGANTFNGIDNYFYGVNDARGDVSTANLRGLGGGNSLILLNGRRIVSHPATQAENNVIATTANLNTLPLLAIERLEILHDGASSVHGSDAVGGVVNAILNIDRDLTAFGLMHGVTEDGAQTRTTGHLQLARPLGEVGRIALFAELSQQDGLTASERSFSSSSDLRRFFSGTPFADDTDLDNRSRATAWGQFKLPQDVSQNGTPLTSGGILHIQPSSAPGCATLIDERLCIDDGLLDRELRHNNNRYRFLSPSMDRINLFTMWSADLPMEAELYGEASWYRSTTEHTREPSNPLSSSPVTIPRDNYWNPFGPVTFPNGQTNPNRLPDIDAPPEGLAVTINTRGDGGFYRVVDGGPRRIVVENQVDRWLVGTRAWLGGWSLDTALVYSWAQSTDVTHDRISNTNFQRALNLSTPDAYNPFNGGDPADLEFGDATANGDAVLESFRIDVTRKNETSLALWDLSLVNPRALTVNERPVGLSVGVEVRREAFRERRDPRLNGSIGYTDLVTGVAYASDVMQSSITPDSQGSRTVYSLFGEVALPLVDEAMRIPFIRRLDGNLAMRLERYTDVGKEWQPRLGLAWWLDDTWAVHASWSEGLRAPNLPQINAKPVPRALVVRDWYRCQALINKGVFDALGECEIEALRGVEVTTSGSANLRAETNTSLSLGLRYRPAASQGVSLSADYWRIDQRNVVGLFGEQNHVSLDYFERLQGRSNPSVVREAPRAEDLLFFTGSGLDPVGRLLQIDEPLVNLDRRTTRGVDLALAYRSVPRAFGTLSASLEATRLLTAEQSVPERGQPIVEAGLPAVPFVGAGNLLKRNGRPKWRASMRVALERDAVDVGLLANYVGDVIDTSTIQDDASRFLPVDAWTSITAFAGLELTLFHDLKTELRLSIGNLLDSEPPIADEDLGYFVGLHDAAGRTWNLSLSAAL